LGRGRERERGTEGREEEGWEEQGRRRVEAAREKQEGKDHLFFSFSPFRLVRHSPPRDTLIIIAPGLSFLSEFSLIRCFVEAFSGTCRERTSDSRRRASSESTYFAPSALAEGLGTLS
jgi:hypothetical protein